MQQNQFAAKQNRRINRISPGEIKPGGRFFMSRKERRIQEENEALVAGFRKRTEFCLAFLVALLILLILRLYYIQISCHDSFAAAAKSQQEIPISGFDSEYNFYYIIEKSRTDARLRELIEVAGGKDITKKSSQYSVYGIKTYDPSLNESLRQDYDAYAFRNCFSAGTSETFGKAKSGKKFRVIVCADAAGNIIPGISPEIRELP